MPTSWSVQQDHFHADKSSWREYLQEFFETKIDRSLYAFSIDQNSMYNH